jgi:hypothetical protein
MASAVKVVGTELGAQKMGGRVPPVVAPLLTLRFYSLIAPDTRAIALGFSCYKVIFLAYCIKH